MKQNSQAVAETLTWPRPFRWLRPAIGPAGRFVGVPPSPNGGPPGVRSLNALAPGEADVVRRVAGSGPIRQRLLELGVTPGTPVQVVRFAPLGDPIEVRVRGYHLSLRRREAEAIWVGWEDPESGGGDATGAARCGAGGQPEQR